MFLRQFRLFAFAGLAALALGSAGALAASQETYITAVLDKGTAPGLQIGFRTSDPGASFVNCTITGSSATCSKENTNSSTKNLGNILCLPVSNAAYKLTSRCQAIINNGAGSCQTNSSAGQCANGTTQVMPVCNYRTSSNLADGAYWVWNVVASATGQYDVDCVIAGFQGPNPK